MTNHSSSERLPLPEQHDLSGELLKHESLLAEFAMANQPLTIERLGEIAPDKLSVVEEAIFEGVGWPDDKSFLTLRPKFTELFDGSLDPVDADELFGHEIFTQRLLDTMNKEQRLNWRDNQILRLHEQGISLTDEEKSQLIHQRGFNNFSVTLSAAPGLPDTSTRTIDNTAIHGSKPYLIRAHKLMPQFIDALQSEVRRVGGHAALSDSLLRGCEFSEDNPREALLLRASRLSYGMMVNLMRSDDLVRQTTWLGLDTSDEPIIVDSHTELWT